MPFICLANANVPNGVLQITDLYPNVSQNNNPTNPPGQSRYLRRVSTDIPAVNQTSGNVEGSPAQRSQANFDGVGAYLLDRVEPGADYTAEATITLNGVQAGDQIVIKGLYFEFFVGANDLVGRAGTVGDPFRVGLGAGDNAAAANLTLALDDAGDVGPALDAVAPLNVHTVATNVGAPSAVVLIQPEDNLAALVKGPDGDLSITTSNQTRVALDADALAVSRFVRTVESWDTTSLQAAVTAIQNRVDNGQALVITDVDTALGTAVGSDLSGATIANSNSTGTLTELLQVLAGRTYRVSAGGSKFTAATAPDTVRIWDATQRGSFTEASTVYDTQFDGGEWTPTNPWIKNGGANAKPQFSGGDTVNTDVAGARNTYDSTHFQASVQNGQLAQFAAGVTLFPDADVQARVAPTLVSKQSRQASLTGQRLVTVYDDDGSLLV